MRYLVFLLLLAACERPPGWDGHEVRSFEIICLKQTGASGFGLSSSGNSVFTYHSYCAVSQCVELRKIYGKNLLHDKTYRVGIAPMDKCL